MVKEDRAVSGQQSAIDGQRGTGELNKKIVEISKI
jgi:hypothetical protein